MPRCDDVSAVRMLSCVPGITDGSISSDMWPRNPAAHKCFANCRFGIKYCIAICHVAIHATGSTAHMSTTSLIVASVCDVFAFKFSAIAHMQPSYQLRARNQRWGSIGAACIAANTKVNLIS